MAAGDTLCVFKPLEHEPPSANYPTLNLRNNHPVLEFDASTIETTYFSGILPRHYGGGAITATVHWITSGTSGAARWGAAIERMSDGATDLDADSFDTDVSEATNASATSGVAAKTEIALTSSDTDGAVAGDAFRLSIRRVANDGSDTLAADAQLLMVELREV